MKSSLGGGCTVENEQEKAIRSGRKIYYMLSLAIFLGLIVLGSVLLGPKILEAAKDPDKFKELLGGSGIKSYLIFIAIQFVRIIFAFIPGEFIEVGAGSTLAKLVKKTLPDAAVFSAGGYEDIRKITEAVG